MTTRTILEAMTATLVACASAGWAGDSCGPGTGDCCEPHGAAGCDDPACCALVCKAVPYCCESGWDAFCVYTAWASCGGECPVPDVCGQPGTGDCCEPSTTGGCIDDSCCSAVCAEEEYCCFVAWDDYCIGLTVLVCDLDRVLCVAAQCGPDAGACCEPNGTPGCDDDECCTSVCAMIPDCCGLAWDQLCADFASFFICFDGACAPPPPLECGDPLAGDCCTAHETASCANAACCEIVCEIFPDCCLWTWDVLCVAVADAVCPPGSCGVPSSCGDPAAGDCFEPNGTPHCDDAACCETVCVAQPACCLTAWDADCAASASILCGGEGILVTIELQGAIAAGPIVRCIEMAIHGCAGSTIVQEAIEFVDGVGAIALAVPRGVAPVECIVARDPLHTLSSVAPVVLETGQLVADLVGDAALRGGNADGNGFIDILDFGLFVANFGASLDPNTACAAAGPQPDFNADGIVDAVDFSFIQTNFFQLDAQACDCAGSPLAADSPVRRIGQLDLLLSGRAALLAADINGDGWLDERDVAAYLAGAAAFPTTRPSTHPTSRTPGLVLRNHR